MAKVKILGDSFTITSAAKVADIKTLNKYNAKALKLYSTDDKKSELFGVGFAANGGSINANGVTFNGEDANGFAYLTQPIKTDAKTAEAKQTAVMEAIGFATISLEKVEAQITTAITAVNEDVETVKASISVVD